MAFATTAAIVGGLALGGGALAVEDFLQTSKTTSQGPVQPTLPTETAAASTATAAQTQARQSALSAGGNTNVTGGSGIIVGGDVSSVTLVGSS